MFLSKAKSTGIYHLYYKKHGKWTKASTGEKTKAAANEFLRTFSEKLKRKKDNPSVSIKLKDFLWEYLKYSESVHSWNTTLSIRSTTRRMNEYFGDITLDSLTHEKLSKYLEHRKRTVSIYVAKRDKAYISGICKWGAAKNQIDRNLVREINLGKLPEKLPVFFSKPEFNKFINAVDSQDLKDLFIFTVNTGLRQMEAVRLRWNQIDMNNKFLILDNSDYLTKSKKVRSIPLNKKAMKVIMKRDRTAHALRDYIFLFEGAAIKQQFISHKFKKLVKKARVNPKLNFHSLRHTFATWVIQKGGSIYEVSKLLGHSNIKTTEIYAHLFPENLRISVNLLND